MVDFGRHKPKLQGDWQPELGRPFDSLNIFPSWLYRDPSILMFSKACKGQPREYEEPLGVGFMVVWGSVWEM